MSIELTAPPLDDPFWQVTYAGGIIEPTDEPSGELTAGISERSTADAFTFYRASIYGSQGYDDWSTASWFEIALNSGNNDCRVLFKSGIEDTPEVPSPILSDWLKAKDAEHALQQVYEAAEKSGYPIVGVCSVERVQLPSGRWINRPVVLGFDLSGEQP